MKRYYLFLLASYFAFCPQLSAKPQKLSLDVKAESAILINAESGAILFEKKPFDQHYPASITKIVTAICALEKVEDKMDVIIAADQDSIGTVSEAAMRKSNYTMPAYYLTPDGCHIGIKRGEELSLRDLFNGMMIASGDDAANIIAKFVTGSIPQFVEQMNSFVRRIGCKSTTFYNPHGLHNPKQLTTAYDMALITREAMKNASFRNIVKTPSCTRPKTNKQEPTTLVQTNKLLRKNGQYYYAKAIGVKTGYYSNAKHTLVAAAKDGDRILIAVLLKSDRNQNFIDAKRLFEAAFSQPRVQRTLLKAGTQQFALDLPGIGKKVGCTITKDLTMEYYPAEEPNLKYQVAWNKKLKLPIAKSQEIGNFLVLGESGDVVRRIPLLASSNIKAGWWETFKRSFSNHSIAAAALLFLALASLTTAFMLAKRKSAYTERD